MVYLGNSLGILPQAASASGAQRGYVYITLYSPAMEWLSSQCDVLNSKEKEMPAHHDGERAGAVREMLRMR
jgi:hypothetical protein